jgi:hypothetical protein
MTLPTTSSKPIPMLEINNNNNNHHHQHDPFLYDDATVPQLSALSDSETDEDDGEGRGAERGIVARFNENDKYCSATQSSNMFVTTKSSNRPSLPIQREVTQSKHLRPTARRYDIDDIAISKTRNCQGQRIVRFHRVYVREYSISNDSMYSSLEVMDHSDTLDDDVRCGHDEQQSTKYSILQRWVINRFDTNEVSYSIDEHQMSQRRCHAQPKLCCTSPTTNTVHLSHDSRNVNPAANATRTDCSSDISDVYMYSFYQF